MRSLDGGTFVQLSDVMTVWLFSFSSNVKSFTGRFKDIHLGKAYEDVHQIILKKVPH